MTDMPTLASAPPRSAQRQHDGVTALQETIATWRARNHFRRDLARQAKDNPHLIDDIGLTGRQVAAEIAKPFWQA
jgi:uncharacterized protein YjiS (DUF1127 family)